LKKGINPTFLRLKGGPSGLWEGKPTKVKGGQRTVVRIGELVGETAGVKGKKEEREGGEIPDLVNGLARWGCEKKNQNEGQEN